MSNQVVAALIGVGGIAVGTAIAGGMTALEARRGARERQRTRREQNLLAAFEYFTGKTQRRSVGLSIIEASWQDMPELLPRFVPLLANQAIYLITQSGADEDAELEYRNLRRIVELLAKPSARPGAEGQYEKVHDVLRKKRSREYPHGLRLGEKDIDEYLRLLRKA